MRTFAVSALILFFTAGSMAYVGQTMLIDSSDEDLCAGGETNTLNRSTQVENDTLVFEGVFCAPNTGYAVKEASVNVNGSEVEALLEIEAPGEDSFAGMAVTPMKFEETQDLGPGTYEIEERIEIEGLDVEEDEFTAEVGSRPEISSGFMSRVVAWFKALF